MSAEQIAVNTIKCLGMDAIQKANSGHPGMVMGMADIATVLWSDFLTYDAQHPNWPNRDRLILSNGHGSMLLYAMLHLTGTSISMDDIKEFRQWGSVTAGHPEYGYAPGIETTTGPLGQGIANGVGMAIAEKALSSRFGSDLIDHYTYVFCGDGCLMEGISAESASLAGHLGLGKLILIYDDNRITIDGSTDITFSEDVDSRFQSYGWDVQRIDGHDHDAIRRAIQHAKKSDNRPSLISCRTIIGKDAPTKAGKSSSHGAPLGVDEIHGAKQTMKIDPKLEFHVPEEAYAFFRAKDPQRQQLYTDWLKRKDISRHGNDLDQFLNNLSIEDVEWPDFTPGQKMATRAASGQIMQAISKALPQFIGGSADLAGSNKTILKDSAFISATDFSGKNIHFGVREHAMAGICNGLSLYGGFRPFCATFLVFHDYMRPSVRLASIMHQPVTYVYTHDSIFVGEDGPTHQPIEHLMSMRLIPNLWVIRPADAIETTAAWKMALSRQDGPAAICLSRQGLPILNRNAFQIIGDPQHGGYILNQMPNADVTLIASGSEVSLALDAQAELKSKGIATNVVSMMCIKKFNAMPSDYKDSILTKQQQNIVIEAGTTYGWSDLLGVNCHAVGINRFGASAPGHIVAHNLGLNVDNIMQKVTSLVNAK